MIKGRKNQVTGQIGEYLVCAELCRKNMFSTTFSGNIPNIDILTIDSRLKTKPIQVKTVSAGTWQCREADKFINIKTSGNIQTVQGKVTLKNPDLIWVFVFLKGEISQDEFYICRMKDVQNIILNKYTKYLKGIGGKRPKNPKSTHSVISRDDLKEKGYENKWETIIE